MGSIVRRPFRSGGLCLMRNVSSWRAFEQRLQTSTCRRAKFFEEKAVMAATGHSPVLQLEQSKAKMFLETL